MKIILWVTLLMVSSLPSWGRTVTVTGYGQAMGYCNSIQGNFCIRRIEDMAERDGERQAQNSCRSQRGTPQGFGARCNARCNPPFLPPSGRNHFSVHCNASCSLSCVIR